MERPLKTLMFLTLPMKINPDRYIPDLETSRQRVYRLEAQLIVHTILPDDLPVSTGHRLRAAYFAPIDAIRGK